jgi:O-antigen/teichoic acid export membrane protein
MEVKGAALLYTLATLAVTLAGLAALLIILRQAAGGALSAIDRFIARTIVGHLFLIMGGALLPPTLALYGLSGAWVWKSSALGFGLPMLAMLLTYQRRRIARTGKAAPPVITVVMMGIGSAAIAAMIGYVFAGLAHPAAAFISALGISFLTHAFSFVVAWDVILRQSEA